MFANKSSSHVLSFLLILVFMLASAPLQVARAAGECYVKWDANGTDTGTSWANAYTTLQSALGTSPCTEIWVAAGTYKPTTGTDRSATFQLKDGVNLYGGFAGTESVRDQRDPQVNLTVLSGDIDDNDNQQPVITDLTTITGNDTNSYHVVSGAADYYTATLDGFTITAGNASGTDPNDRGAGFYNAASGPLVISDVTFGGNVATYAGGGVYNINNDITLMNVTFNANFATYGGGMFHSGGDPALTNITFSGNSAAYGGGFYNADYGTPTMRNVTFSGNSASTNGGGLAEYGSYTRGFMLYNVTFSGNTAGSYGGGLYNTTSIYIRNTIFWGNTAADGAQVYNYHYNGGGEMLIPINDSVVQDGCPARTECTNVIDADPKLGTLGDYGGLTLTIPIQAGSSAIDAGDDSVCPATDQRGVTRPQGAQCDIGAYELAQSQYTITGNAGVGGAILNYTGGTPVSAASNGNYSITVPSGWSGTVTPSKTGYTFTPTSITVTTPVTSNLTGQDFTATLNTYSIYLPLVIR